MTLKEILTCPLDFCPSCWASFLLLLGFQYLTAPVRAVTPSLSIRNYFFRSETSAKPLAGCPSRLYRSSLLSSIDCQKLPFR